MAGGAAGRARPADPAVVHANALLGMRVLLVEDNDVNQDVASEILRAWGAMVDFAGNGQVALEKLDACSRETYDVILMDLEMPVMDGTEALRRLRADDRFTNLPVIVMTAHTLGKELDAVRSYGVSGQITKPFEPEELLRLLYPYRPGRVMYLPSIGELPSPSTAEIAHIAALETIDEIDLAVLLRRFGDRIPFLLKALRGFALEAEGFVERLRGAMRDGDWPGAHRLAHSFKGLAGTFALNGLHNLLGELEARTATAAEVGDMEHLVVALDAMLESLLARLALLPQSKASERPPLPELGDPHAILLRLRQYLTEGEGEAEELWRQNKPLLANFFTPLQLTAIERAIARWDVDQALSVLEGISIQKEIYR